MRPAAARWDAAALRADADCSTAAAAAAAPSLPDRPTDGTGDRSRGAVSLFCRLHAADAVCMAAFSQHPLAVEAAAVVAPLVVLLPCGPVITISKHYLIH